MALFDQSIKPRAKQWFSLGRRDTQGQKTYVIAELDRTFQASPNTFRWELKLSHGSRPGRVVSFADEPNTIEFAGELQALGITSDECVHLMPAIESWVDDNKPRLQKFMEEKKDG